MSGYGGSPPPGWQDPYGGSQGWSGDPYGGDPYGGGAYGAGYSGYGYGPPGMPTKPPRDANTVAALVCNIVGVLLCCGVLSIPGVITSAIAMGRLQSDPESARKLTVWSWVLFGASVVFGIIFIVIYIFVVIFAESNGYDSTY
ncbi:DUF4190 domain-containing protein [Actinomadura livida]|uniref:DUF4190 domain-containing protein n=1 Tax=Actinomadura livida TaxID=79909 RepID=A0A7W7MWM4_9ACTN|nr:MULTISPECIES: DUF4190 domain-containing protein [Actinomadura]MBB4772984.1 hypothetical protein [Actinomadura catellatispora]GGU17266.1 hypothetical protein GCM10010208_47640 [Actinomadura livida]